MNRWNEICFLIKKHTKENSKEAFFQNEVINIFEKLGWSRYKKEIETEKNIPIGASNSLRLDILISLEEKKLFVVELKKPTNQGSERVSQQLISYMLQLKMKFGLFIGENIQVFYDDPNDNKHPIKLIEIEFSENNEEGYKLIELLKRDTFDENNLIQYCKEKLIKIEDDRTKNELIDFLTSSQGNEYVSQLISKDLKQKHSSKIIDELESNISIIVKSNKSVQQNRDLIKEENFHSSGISSTKNLTEEEEIISEINKVERKIPLWLSNSRKNNINSQIFTNFMELLENNEFVEKNRLVEVCKEVDKFEGNFSQMSQFGPKNHAKIFDVKKNQIRLWKPIETFVKEYYNNNKN
jgi:hypothetical protein